MNKYENGKIYTIRCKNDDTLIYVGSTIQPLHQRWSGHKVDSLRHPNTTLYQEVNNNWDEWFIELYETFSCNSKEELNKREGEVMREIGTLNKRIEGKTLQEKKTNKTEYDKDYRQENADKLKEQKKEYQLTNADKIQEYQKKYRQNNTEKNKEYMKIYNQVNADKIKEKKRENYQRKKLEKQKITL